MRWIGVAAALTVAACLSGCGTLDARPDATPDVTSSGTPSADTPLAVPDGVVATAALLGRDGTPLGEVEVVAKNGRFDLVLPDVDIDALGSRLMIALADADVDPSTCAEDNVYQIGFETTEPAPEPTFGSGPWPEDPTYWKTVLYLPYSVEPAVGDGCRQPILASAKLTWTLPVLRPWVLPRDDGPRTGAAGAVVSEGGTPSTYTTAAGDTWSDIADRFGISEEDLDWLNPIRLGNFAPGTAYADQILNLDPTGRGDSESRRPR